MLTQPNFGIVLDRIVNTVGSYAATAPVTGGGTWLMQLVAFKGDLKRILINLIRMLSTSQGLQATKPKTVTAANASPRSAAECTMRTAASATSRASSPDSMASSAARWSM